MHVCRNLCVYIGSGALEFACVKGVYGSVCADVARVYMERVLCTCMYVSRYMCMWVNVGRCMSGGVHVYDCVCV